MITSSTNSQIKQIDKLNKAAKERRKTGQFIVEGIRMFAEIPKDLLVKAYATECFYEANASMFEGIDYEFVSDSVFRGVSDTTTPQGVLCIVKQMSWGLEQLLQEENPLLVVLENVQDPGNLGTIIRTAEGAGVTGVIMSRDTVDIYNSKVVRSTMGSIFRVPFVYVEDIVDTVKCLNDQGIHTYAAHLDGESMYGEDYADATAFLMGNEGNGLTNALSEAASHKIRIPMKGQVESLNVATATTVLIYEAMRQRS